MNSRPVPYIYSIFHPISLPIAKIPSHISNPVQYSKSVVHRSFKCKTISPPSGQILLFNIRRFIMHSLHFQPLNNPSSVNILMQLKTSKYTFLNTYLICFVFLFYFLSILCTRQSCTDFQEQYYRY